MADSETILEIKGKTYLQNPQGQIMDSDGENVAIAVYGARWQTSGTVIRALLEGRSPDWYKDFKIEWHPAGTWFEINEWYGVFLHPSTTIQQEQEREVRKKEREEESHQRHLEQWDGIANEMYQQVTSEFEDSLRLCMGGRTFFIHLPVARSIPYFRVLLESGFKETTDKTSTLEVSTPVIADYFIEFMYRGKMGEGYVEYKDELLSLADMLQYDHLLEYFNK